MNRDEWFLTLFSVRVLKTFRRPSLRILLAGLLMLASCILLVGQNVVPTGSLSGQVSDSSGAVIPGASVLVRSLATGVERSATSNHAGIYKFASLVPGAYSVKASLKGFRNVEILTEVQIGRSALQDIKLQVGASTDTVKVTGIASLLRPGESSESTVIDRSLIQDLPMNGRKYTDLAVLTPNTSYDGDTGLVSIAGQQGGEDSGYANGNGFNNFTVDGNNSTSNYFDDIVGRYRIPYLYGENSIQEFQISVAPYSSVYGGGAGFVNAVTRSGTNAFHGNAFYYNRPSATGANDAIDIANGFPKPYDQLQQFGERSAARSSRIACGSLPTTSNSCETTPFRSSIRRCKPTRRTCHSF